MTINAIRRHFCRIGALALFTILTVLVTDVWAITMSWSPVGNPGNAADSTGYGAVNYSYNIGTYDVSNSQYVAFLNSNDPTGANLLGLYTTGMGDPAFGGIIFNSGAATGQKYSVIPGNANYPVMYESWYSALRFANWMDNGQIGGDTESGAYNLLGNTPTPSNAATITRSAGATIVLPSESEWYKAAYYDPATHLYFQYPTSSNTVPTASGPTGTPNSANYDNVFGDLTNVGAYSGTTSPYGAFDMGGDVFQWNEASIDGSLRGANGGAWNSPSSFWLQSSQVGTGFDANNPVFVGAGDGFRLASVPEPSTAVLAVLACGAALLWRRRFKSPFSPCLR